MKILLGLALFFAFTATLHAQTTGLPSRVSGTVGNCVNIAVGNVPGDAGAACGTGGGGGSFPLTFVQERSVSFSNSTSFVLTFPQTAAASGNTLFALIGGDFTTTLNTPAGWSVDFNQTQTTTSRLVLMHKTTASDTGVTFTTSGTASMGVYFFEVAGVHTLDVRSSGGVANTNFLGFPAITPTANSVVFAFAGLNIGSPAGIPWITYPSAEPWKLITVWPPGTGGFRTLQGYVLQSPASGALVTPPLLDLTFAGQFAGAGLAFATFSIL